MDPREQRGLVIAALNRVAKIAAGKYYVPSQTNDGTRYTVLVNGDVQKCNCPDHETRRVTCKHIHAVLYTIRREQNPDGTTTVTETLTVAETVEKRTTYPQNWSAYNTAQSVEKDYVQELLADLCQGIPEPERTGRGRKPHTVKDSLFSMVFKVYSTFSSRRFSSDLREAHERGHLSKPIPGMKTVQFFENPDFAPILKQLVVQSALPLRAVETAFAIDSSGFGSNKFVRWIDEKYGTPRQETVWVKCHLACGVKTNVVTAVRVLDKDSADYTQFTPLVKETAEGFTIGEVSADKAYSGVENFETVAGCGGTAFIAFKSNATGAAGGTFQKMFGYFQYKRDEFLQYYHRRSNVESVFSMVKRKFGDSVRSRTDVAMVNEVYCKLIAHNLCVLVQEVHELGIAPEFWKNQDTRLIPA